MKNFFRKTHKAGLVLAGLIIFPVVYAAVTFLILISPINTTGLAKQMGLLMLIFFFGLVDSGKLIFFSYILAALGVSATALSIMVFVKKLRVFRQFAFYYFLIGLLMILYLAGEGTLYEGYVPALKPKDGVRHWIIDYPRKGFDNLYRKILVSVEGMDGKYEIAGWLNNEILIYKKQEGSRYHLGPEQIWQFDTSKSKSDKYTGSADNMIKNICEYQECMAELVETTYSAMGQCRKVVVSPDSKKMACLTQYTYGPEDIIILEKP